MEEAKGSLVLDTDIFVDFFRGVGKAHSFIEAHADEISFSALTEAELLSGAVCSDPREWERVLHILAQFDKIPIDNPLVQIAGDFRRNYKIAMPDALIAASAFSSGAVLVTRNVRDFEKIEGLKLQVPY